MNIETEDANTFEQFELNESLLKTIKDLGYETPTPIQLKTIPLLLEGNDIVGMAQTGTGKTAAFALPSLHKIDTKSNKVQVLVLVPTRELALQVAEAFHNYAKRIGRIRVLPIYGGTAIFQQVKHLREGVQVVVGTPGRVMDHLRRETLDFSNLKIVVLDEADEMLRMGFSEDVEFILGNTPKERQTALFSATMPRQVRRIADKYLTDAINVEIERKTMEVPLISQFYVNVSEGQKADTLTRILEVDSNPNEATLIFHRTKIGAADLASKLQARGYSAEAMHGDMSQAQREITIKRLKNGQVEIVVATDVAARGLDVDRITTVINYDVPGDSESYVHRIGRTGRAGREGRAILFVTPKQNRIKADIERYTKQNIEQLRMPTQADVAKRRISVLKDKVLAVLNAEKLDLHLSLVEDLANESGFDIAEIAAAAILLVGGDKPIKVKPEQMSSEQSARPNVGNEEMVRLFINIGRSGKVSPANIVGAISNEADVPGKAIGAIDIYDRYTLVDIPAEYKDQVLSQMKNTRICRQRVTIRLADGDTTINQNTRPKPQLAERFSELKEFISDDEPKREESTSFDKPFRSNTFDKPFRENSSSFDKPYREKSSSSFDKPRRESSSSFDKPYAKKKVWDDKPYRENTGSTDRPYAKRNAADDRPYKRKTSDSGPFREIAKDFDKPYQRDDKPFRSNTFDKPFTRGKRVSDDKPLRSRGTDFDKPVRRKRTSDDKPTAETPFYKAANLRPKKAKATAKKAVKGKRVKVKSKR
jgi:ATP-dependent RNA helicase DeaD